jgi:hypothetical protein
MRQFVMSLVVCLLFSVSASAQHVRTFEDPNANCPGCYGFDSTYARTNWTTTHLPTGGWNGTGAPQITLLAGREQYGFGFNGNSGLQFVSGESAFIRLRFKWAPGFPSVNSGQVRIKFFLHGGNSSLSRTIMFLGTNDVGACLPGQQTNPVAGTGYNKPGYSAYHLPSDYGGSGVWDGRTFGFIFQRNIEGPASCGSPPILVQGNGVTPLALGYTNSRFGTHRGGPSPVNGDGWFHLQFEARCNADANLVYFKAWANHNVYGEPTSFQAPLRTLGGGLTPMQCGDWGGYVLGAFVDTTPGANISYIVDDFQMSKSFDPAWYPGAAPPPPPPPAPVNCVGSWSTWVATSDWTVCENGQQSRTESRLFTVTTPASNGGTACEASHGSTQTRTVTQPCTVEPPPPPPPPTEYACTITGQSKNYVNGDERFTLRCPQSPLQREMPVWVRPR